MNNPYLFALVIGIAFLTIALFAPFLARFAEWWWDKLDGWLEKINNRKRRK